jgi:hypothetical protein
MLKIELPRQLQEEFERVARSLYDQDGPRQALIEAIEAWLVQHRRPVLEAEVIVNNQTFEQLRAELEHDHWGQWVVIAHGKLQGIGGSLAEVAHLAPTAQHRIVMQIGESRPKEVELGWQMAFN